MNESPSIQGKVMQIVMPFFLVVLGVGLVPETLFAQTTCTTEAIYNVSTTPMISRIIETVDLALLQASEQLFLSITDPASGFREVVVAAMMLYLAIYGVMFMTGIIQLSGGDAVIRLLKVITLFVVFSPQGWQFIDNILVEFFRRGVEELVGNISQVMLTPFNGVGEFSTGCGWTPPTPPNPVPPGYVAPTGPPALFILDCAAQQVFSKKFGITLAAAALTGPYGFIFAILLIVGMILFIKAIGQAIWIYFMFLVVNTLLLGLAPFFLAFMLFAKTRFLFDGWMQQLVNYSLQPIFMFVFLGIFIAMITTTIANILHVEKCWSVFQNIIGTNLEINFWRFMKFSNPDDPLSPQVEDTRSAEFDGMTMKDAAEPVFPIDIMDVLIFILICSIAGRFSKFVLYISKEISGGFMILTELPGSLSQWFNATKARAGSSARAFAGGHSTSTGGTGVAGFAGAKHEWKHHLK